MAALRYIKFAKRKLGAEHEWSGDEPRPRGDGRRFISFAGVVILIAVAVAIIAVLLGLGPEIGQIGQPETSPPPPVTEPVEAIEPIGIRIEYDELLRLVDPYLELYRQGLPPFDVMRETAARRFNFPDPNITFSAFDAQLESFGIRGIDPANRTEGIYATIGKVTSPWKNCTGIIMGSNIMLTADHCLPWGDRSNRI